MFLKCRWVFTGVEMFVKRGWGFTRGEFSPVICQDDPFSIIAHTSTCLHMQFVCFTKRGWGFTGARFCLLSNKTFSFNWRWNFYSCKSRVRFNCGGVLARILAVSEVWRNFPPFLINECCWWNQMLPRRESLATIYVKCDFQGGLLFFFFFFADCSEIWNASFKRMTGCAFCYVSCWVLFCACISPSVGVW